MQNNHVDKEWVDYPTAERFSSLSHTTLWRHVQSGQIKAAKIGRSVRIHLPSLRAFMEERCSYAGKLPLERVNNPEDPAKRIVARREDR